MQKIFETIEAYQMIPPGVHVVVGVSGGADSVCLLKILTEYQKKQFFSLSVVHIEHGIRGEESLSDAGFVKELCEAWKIPFHMERIDVQQIAREQGLSVEEAGRMQRYRFFEKEGAVHGEYRIAVAHNQNDQAETVLWNLVRGSGLHGLRGIAPKNGKIIRPLLFTDRSRIEELLKEFGIGYRVDSTNLQKEYTRNRIRLSLLPQMEEQLNAKAVFHIAQAAKRLLETEEFVNTIIDSVAQKCIQKEKEDWILDLNVWSAQEKFVQKELLLRLISNCGGQKDLGRIHIEALEELAGKDCGKRLDLPGGFLAVREKGIIRVGKKQNRTSQDSREAVKLQVPGMTKLSGWRIHTEIVENSPVLLNKISAEKKYTKWMSYDTIKNGLSVRKRCPGDYIVINKNGGKQKLKDYFINQKIPAKDRENIYLLADGSRILWIIGYRLSEDAKVCEDTVRVIKIQVEETR